MFPWQSSTTGRKQRNFIIYNLSFFSSLCCDDFPGGTWSRTKNEKSSTGTHVGSARLAAQQRNTAAEHAQKRKLWLRQHQFFYVISLGDHVKCSTTLSRSSLSLWKEEVLLCSLQAPIPNTILAVLYLNSLETGTSVLAWATGSCQWLQLLSFCSKTYQKKTPCLSSSAPAPSAHWKHWHRWVHALEEIGQQTASTSGK